MWWKSLLAHGADINAKDDYNQTPLHEAVTKGRKDVVEVLLANKAQINGRDNAGKTPLAYAVSNNFTDIAKMLREHGATE